MQSVAHTLTKQVEHDDQGAEKWSEKNACKFIYNHKDVKYTFGMANDKFNFGANTQLYNENDMKVQGDFASEHKPAKDERKATVALDVTSPDMGGARLMENVSATSFLINLVL